MKRRRNVKAISSGTKGLDRISALLQHLIEEILLRLPLRDAVRTSVLSSKWREKWTTLPRIEFLSWSFRNDITEAIDTIFSFHQGPLKAFDLAVLGQHPKYSDVRRWIRHLSRLSINELKIHIGICNNFYLGSCLFACRDLISLDLNSCSFRLPSNFAGLKNLRFLVLRPALVAQGTLEKLVSSCPQLNKLEITVPQRCDGFRYSHLKITALILQHLKINGRLNTLKIDAPNLQHLDLEFARLLEDMDVINTNCLLSLRLIHYDNRVRDTKQGKADALLKLFVQQSQLQYVDLNSYSTQNLSLSGFPDMLCNSLVHLKHLKVSLYFISVEEISATLCLLRSCPNLESIVFSQEFYRHEGGIEDAESKFLQDNSSSCLFEHLKNVWVLQIRNNKAETSFLKFVMLSSPILENMVIKSTLSVSTVQAAETVVAVSTSE